MLPAIGIDFGTTNSVAALRGADGSLRTLRLPGGDVFRSVLCFWAGADGRPRDAAGPAAIDAYLESPLDSRLIMSMKSYLAQRSFTETRIFGGSWTLEALIALFLWWFSTGAILMRVRKADNSGPDAHLWSVLLGLPLLFAGVFGFHQTLDDASPFGVHMAFLSALAIWGWIELAFLSGVITGPNGVKLLHSGRELSARYTLVATGGHPQIPEIPGKELGITSNEAFHLKALPHSILIEGGGYIAVEFATIFAGLGVDTTIIYRGDCVLRGFDEDMRRGLEAGLTERGIKLIYQTTIARLEKRGTDILATMSDGVSAPYGAVMFATGRRPNTHGLGLAEAGVKLHAHGAIEVDEYSRTSVASIYAVGDVTNRAQLTPVAIREGSAFAATVFNNTPTTVDYSLIGTAVFAEPELATIGLNEADAATHDNIDVYLARFRPMMNTLSTKSERVIMKLITEADGGRVLGLHILGPGAAEMVHMGAIAMGMRANKADFDRAMAMHPTAAEELVTFKAPSYVYRGGKKQ